jgi:hypothetical protein
MEICGRTMSAIAAGRMTHMDVGNATSPSATPWMGEVGKMPGAFSRTAAALLHGDAVLAVLVGGRAAFRDLGTMLLLVGRTRRTRPYRPPLHPATAARSGAEAGYALAVRRLKPVRAAHPTRLLPTHHRRRACRAGEPWGHYPTNCGKFEAGNMSAALSTTPWTGRLEKCRKHSRQRASLLAARQDVQLQPCRGISCIREETSQTAALVRQASTENSRRTGAMIDDIRR